MCVKHELNESDIAERGSTYLSPYDLELHIHNMRNYFSSFLEAFQVLIIYFYYSDEFGIFTAAD